MTPGTRTEQGSAAFQAELWGERAADWAQIAEQAERPWLGPAYDLVLERLRVGPGTRLLDVGCGAGRFCRLAADRGARVHGIDATPALLAFARERVPGADLRQGDLQFLPFPDAAFDIVTGFNSFFYAADVGAALGEAARVLRRGGSLGLTAFGRPERCESTPVFEYLGPLLPQLALGDDGDDAAGGGRLEDLIAAAGLAVHAAGYLPVTEEHPDLDTASREFLASAPLRLAVRESGEVAVRDSLAAALAPLQAPDGRVRITDEYRYVLARRP